MSASRPRAAAPRRYKRTVRLPVGRSAVRIRLFMVVIGLVLIGTCVRAVQLQGLDADAYAAEAAKKMASTRDLPADRGTISDRNGVVLATTEPAMVVSIDPEIVRTNGADKRWPIGPKKQEEIDAVKDAVADILVRHLAGKREDYIKAIETPDTRYKVVARKVPAATFSAIQAT